MTYRPKLLLLDSVATLMARVVRKKVDLNKRLHLLQLLKTFVLRKSYVNFAMNDSYDSLHYAGHSIVL